MKNLRYIEMGYEGLDLIQPLWEELNQHHLNKKSDFKEHYKNFTFQERKEVLMGKACNGSIRVDLAEDLESETYIGYCVTTISPENQGEIDSIYVKEEYRSQGIGDQLMKRSLNWMNNRGVDTKKVVVAFGNQEAVYFYESYGFRPRSITLEQTADKK